MKLHSSLFTIASLALTISLNAFGATSPSATSQPLNVNNINNSCDVKMSDAGQYYVTQDKNRASEDMALEDAINQYLQFVATDRCRTKDTRPTPYCKVKEISEGMWVAVKVFTDDVERISKPMADNADAEHTKTRFVETGLCTNDAAPLDVCGMININYRYYITKNDAIYSHGFYTLRDALFYRRDLINTGVCKTDPTPTGCYISIFNGFFFIKNYGQFLSGYYRYLFDAEYDLDQLSFEGVCTKI